MTDKGCPTRKISSFAEQNASLCDPPHPPGDSPWAIPLVPAGSQTPRLSTPTLLDGSPPGILSTAKASLLSPAGRRNSFVPKPTPAQNSRHISNWICQKVAAKIAKTAHFRCRHQVQKTYHPTPVLWSHNCHSPTFLRIF